VEDVKEHVRHIMEEMGDIKKYIEMVVAEVDSNSSFLP